MVLDQGVCVNPHSSRVMTGYMTRACVYPHSSRVMTWPRTRVCVCTHIRLELRQGLGPGHVCIPTFV